MQLLYCHRRLKSTNRHSTAHSQDSNLPTPLLSRAVSATSAWPCVAYAFVCMWIATDRLKNVYCNTNYQNNIILSVALAVNWKNSTKSIACVVPSRGYDPLFRPYQGRVMPLYYEGTGMCCRHSSSWSWSPKQDSNLRYACTPCKCHTWLGDWENAWWRTRHSIPAFTESGLGRAPWSFGGELGYRTLLNVFRATEATTPCSPVPHQSLTTSTSTPSP